MGRVLACADIGSNTVHMLIAETNGEDVRRIDNRSEWLGLGERVARSKKISGNDAQQLVTLLAEYRGAARALKAEAFYIFATEAVRSAVNHRDVLERIRKEARLNFHVIPPHLEVEFSLRGARIDTGAFEEMTLFEVGGGSIQVAHVDQTEVSRELSLPLGTGRVIAAANLTNPCPPDRLELARAYVQGHLAEVRGARWPRPAVASGGVVRGLWRALHPDGEKELAKEEIAYLLWSASRLTAETASMRFNCKLKRAATLLPGALVYQELMKSAGFDKILITEYGIREGAILKMASGELDEWLS